MDKVALQNELDAAYKNLDRADKQIKNLLIERKQNLIVIEILAAGNFITEGKLEEVREFVQILYGERMKSGARSVPLD